MATIIDDQVVNLSDTSTKPVIDISSADNITVVIEGTFVATWVLQASLDGTNWINFALHQNGNVTATADIATNTSIGAFITKPCTGLKFFRPSLTAYTSGTVIFKIYQTMLEK